MKKFVELSSEDGTLIRVLKVIPNFLQTYLEEYMHPDQLDGELMLAPGFSTPPNMDYQGYHSYISNNLPAESPILYGLHPNAEIGFLTATSEVLFRTVFELQPRESGATGGPATTRYMISEPVGCPEDSQMKSLG